jgi:hypothetical protein
LQLRDFGLKSKLVTCELLNLSVKTVDFELVVGSLLFLLGKDLSFLCLVNFDEEGELGLEFHNLGEVLCVEGLLPFFVFALGTKLLFGVILLLGGELDVSGIDHGLELSTALLHLGLELGATLLHVSLEGGESSFMRLITSSDIDFVLLANGLKLEGVCSFFLINHDNICLLSVSMESI